MNLKLNLQTIEHIIFILSDSLKKGKFNIIVTKPYTTVHSNVTFEKIEKTARGFTMHTSVGIFFVENGVTIKKTSEKISIEHHSDAGILLMWELIFLI